MSGAEQAVVTHLDESVGEHVLEEAPDELFSSDGATLELVSGRLFVSESDLAIMHLAQSVVTNSDTKDVRGEILEGLFAGADWFGVDHPVVFAQLAHSSNVRFLSPLREASELKTLRSFSFAVRSLTTPPDRNWNLPSGKCRRAGLAIENDRVTKCSCF